MSRIKTSLICLLCGVGLIGGAIANRQRHQDLTALPANPATTPVEILHAQSFQLDQPFTFEWRNERPEVQSGFLLVLKTDPKLVQPRQTYEAVLYVGDQTAERCNGAYPSGHLVALVPAGVLANGNVDLDPTSVPIWFGTPELPERVDAARIAQELALAEAQGVGPQATSRLSAQSLAAQDSIYAANRDELDFYIADLIELYSPAESELVELLRMPRSW
ncbi:MAG: hypothetical protein CMJ89_10200 [Planctomycetes bacterium]|jgi:hypothetical protein|nr:hypothetical protein [Planctomycetota bacterium]